MTDEIAVPDALPLTALLSNVDALKELPVEAMERLFALHERSQAEQARREFAVAMAKVQAETTPVKRRGHNKHTGSSHALMEDIERMLDPIIQANGFSCSTSTEPSDQKDHIRFCLLVRHVGGHSETHRMDLPIDDIGSSGKRNKTRMQGSTSAYSYGRRVLKTHVWDVVLIEDNDGNAPLDMDVATPEQVGEIDDLIMESEVHKDNFLEWLRVDRLSDMTPTLYEKARRTLKRRIENNKRGSDDRG